MKQGTSIHQSIIHLLPHIQGKVGRAPAQSEKLWPPTPQQPPSAYPRKHIEIPRPAERYNLAHCYEPFSPCTTAVKCWSELLSPILLTVCVDRISRHSHAVGRPPPLWPQDFISTFCGWCNSVGGLPVHCRLWLEWEISPPHLRPWYSARRGWSTQLKWRRSLRVSGSCLWVRRRERETDRIGATAAVVQMLHWSIVVKKAECKCMQIYGEITFGLQWFTDLKAINSMFFH